MNTSGGVLEVQIDSGNPGHGRCSENILKEFQSKLLRIITREEKWIPRPLFLNFVKTHVQEKSSKVYYFINKSNDLITHRTYAYIHESDDVKLMTDHEGTCKILRQCFCKDEYRCQHHKNAQPELQSALSGTTQLNIDMDLPHTLRRLYFCRYYQIHDRSLTEVLCTQSVSNDIKELVSALANTDGGSIFLGVTHTDTPVVKGYKLGDISVQQLNECLSSQIDGQGGTAITFWANGESVCENWKLSTQWSVVILTDTSSRFV